MTDRASYVVYRAPDEPLLFDDLPVEEQKAYEDELRRLSREAQHTTTIIKRPTEQARLLGMGLGVRAYNDAMGY